MIGHTDGGPVADLQVPGGNLHTLFLQGPDLLIQMCQIDNHAVAHYIDNFRTQNTRGQKVQDKFPPGIDHRMAGIVAALVTDHNIVFLRQQVYHTALSFITPVDASDRC